jgi:hypothetical protein
MPVKGQGLSLAGFIKRSIMAATLNFILKIKVRLTMS